jgi:hypothetical protein
MENLNGLLRSHDLTEARALNWERISSGALLDAARPLGTPSSNRMRIRQTGGARNRRRRIEAPGCEFKHRLNLLPRDIVLLDYFFNARAHFKVFKNRSHRHPGILKKTHAPLRLPGTLSTAGHCDQSRLPAMMSAPSFRLTRTVTLRRFNGFVTSGRETDTF